MDKYLLRKLAEEASEVAVAAIKVHHKGNKRNKARLHGEVADVVAILQLLGIDVHVDHKRIDKLVKERVRRESDRT